jgi:HEAT repeat protein
MNIKQVEEMILQKNWEAIEVMAGFDPPSIMPLLTGLARHEDWEVRQLSLMCLNQLKNDKAAQALAEALDDSNSNVRGYAAGLLKENPHPRILPKLLDTVSNHSDDYVRENVALVIGLIGEKSAVKPLKKALITEQNEEVRSNIIQAVARLEDEDGRKVILQELRGGDKKAQFDAIQKVEYINDSALALHIRPFLDDETPILPLTADPERVQFIRMNDAAAKAIAVLLNQPFSFRIEHLRPCTDAEIDEVRTFFQKK